MVVVVVVVWMNDWLNTPFLEIMLCCPPHPIISISFFTSFIFLYIIYFLNLILTSTQSFMCFNIIFFLLFFLIYIYIYI